MITNLKSQLKSSIETSLKKHFTPLKSSPTIEIEIPQDKNHGELSVNIALKSAKLLKKPPIEIANLFIKDIESGLKKYGLDEKIERVEVKKPGFINFYLSRNAVYSILSEVLKKQKDFGRSGDGQGEKIQIEFVSANPTGPLSVAHARQAAVGDALGNILEFIGYDVSKEYYVNDEGNQINLLGDSVRLFAKNELETCSLEELLTDDHYRGDYVGDIARLYMKKKKITKKDDLKDKEDDISRFAVKVILDMIKEDLDEFGVHFDVWRHQSEVATEKEIKKTLEDLKRKGFIKEEDGALWFKSRQFGDDKDRVVKKSDGTYTYLTPDIVYHKDKYRRGFKHLVNIWGPDHHGYIPRLTAAIEALGQKKESFRVLIVQLATIYRGGKPISMSTRRGEFISLREVIDEVGVDAARFFFLMRHINAHLDFDLELAKKETAENPVYYIQYAHARIYSIIAKAKKDKLYKKAEEFSLLVQPEEMDLIKEIGNFPDILLMCRLQWDAYALVNYLMELATCFHKFYDKHRVVDSANPGLSSERLALIDASRIVLANGLRLLGVSQPQSM